MRNFLMLILLLASTFATVHAQPVDRIQRTHPVLDENPISPEHLAQIRAAKEAFLREELALTEKEAGSFFPLYWRYEQELRQIRRQLRPNPAVWLTDATPSEAEAKRELSRNQTERQRSLDLHVEAENAYLEVLSAVKVLKLNLAEHKFRRKLLRRMKQSRGGR